MKIEDLSKPKALGIQAAGLTITACAVMVIALCAQLLVRALTLGAIAPAVSVLSLGFVAYVISNAVAYATSQEPDSAQFLVANALVQLGFLGLAWALFLSAFPWAWLSFASAFVLVVHAARFGFARLRTRRVRKLLEHGVAAPSASLERCFFSHSALPVSVPLGALLGVVWAAFVGATGLGVLRQVLAGVCATVGAGLLVLMLRGARALARDFVETHAEACIRVRAVSSFDQYRVRMWAPAELDATLSVQMARVAADVRRACVVNQMQHVTLFAIASLVLMRLTLPRGSAPAVLGALLLVALLATQLPYALGQRATNARALGAIHEADRREVRQHVREQASARLFAGAWAALGGACALSALAYACVDALVRRFAG